MDKTLVNMEVTKNSRLTESVHLLHLRPEDNRTLPAMYPGQFVNVYIDSANVFLRRPISICNFDISRNEIQLIVKNVGKGSYQLCDARVGDIFNCLLPLGNSFRLPDAIYKKVLLIGGGVGTAPLYFLSRWFNTLGITVNFLIGARSENELIFIEKLRDQGTVNICTDDGSFGVKGYVTAHPVFSQKWDDFYVCGPSPMMKLVARSASERNIRCQVSLENRMACGLGACLCCVEDTIDGNKCVCTSGPVFNIKDLKW